MSIICATIFLCFIVILAWWESELIKKGKSDHTPKWMWLTLMCGMMFVMHYESSWQRSLVIIGIFVFEYFSMFDYILNFIRKVPDPMNYELFGKPWMKFIGMLVWVFLVIYYFFV